MANLSELTADAYKAAQVVGRERMGYCNAALVNSDESVAALGSNISSMYAPPATAIPVSPGSVLPDADDQNLTQRSLPVNQLQGVPIRWSGEQVKRQGQTSRGSSGQSYETVLGAQIEQAVRALANAIESEVQSAVNARCGYAIGTAGTTPFASDINLLSDARAVLDAVGAPEDGLCVVAGNAAVAQLRKNDEFTKGETTNTDMGMLRTGVLSDIHGMRVYQSGQVDRNRGAASAPAGAQAINLGAGYGVGDTSFAIDGGAGACPTGSFVQIDGHTVGGTNVALGVQSKTNTALVTQAGLLAAVANDADIDAVGAQARNVAFHMNAIEIAIRPPMAGRDLAVESIVIMDPKSQLVFRLAQYPGYMEHQFHVQALFGVYVWQPEHVVAILG